MMNKSVLEFKAVTKKYANFIAVDNMNFTLDKGEVLGLFGHNGAGKSTIMKLILNLFKPSSGSVEVCSNLGLIGYLPENVSFYEQLTGLEVISYFTKLKRLKDNNALDMLEKVGLTFAMNRQVKTYSKGMRQKLGLAQAMLGSPKLLLLDEPTVGLDPIATQDFYQNVQALKQDGCSVILCSHVLLGVEQYLDKALIIARGQKLGYGTITELSAQSKLPLSIKVNSKNGLSWLTDVLYEYYDKEKDLLLVPLDKEMEVLKLLIDEKFDSIANLQINGPNLEKLYRHFIENEVSLC